ncbi:helix-turn-helix transcriptional regulator [Streptomyces sp. NPDC014733]|uniref:helix-turn-helix transcriptional regulator n=1 Tax=Streptomyces sp. NPDC014733 TaxID=3364885 RepID=UPI0036F61A1D
MDQRTELSEFLRSRRARLRPGDVGLPEYGRRRVPGLRREELAQLAGVSVAYYIRLEQGRVGNVSAAVLDAIGDALRLTGAERDHLAHLARPVPRRRARPAVRPQRVRPAVQQLLDTMDAVPAYVIGRRLDIIAWNGLACALLGDFPALPRKERNLAWQVFLDPAARALYENWEAKAADVVGYLRRDAGRHPDDPALASLIGELSLKSEDFRRLWAAHDVQDKGFGTKVLRHPVVGRLTLAYETLSLPADPGQQLIAYHAEPGSPSAQSLRLLASWSLEPARPRPEGAEDGTRTGDDAQPRP